MTPRFSLVYPTRHRPAFIRQALRFLEKQEYRDFEVIVSDNYQDAALSCEAECRSTSLNNLTYVHPPRSLSMVENWNFALDHASGEYICYFTDKMFLLPQTLTRANDCIEQTHAEILTWIDNSYTPKKFPEYFGEGLYETAVSSNDGQGEYYLYDPVEELSKKGNALVSRNEQDKSSYARGKICFGAYSADLCRRIVEKTNTLFHKVSPDYTSMILGLSLATRAAEINQPGIVHVNTDLSNGGQSAIRDELALGFLVELGNAEEIMSNYLVPNLYSSIHNAVTYDYLTLKKKFELGYEFNPIHWLAYIAEDLDDPARKWSSLDVERQQRKLLDEFVNALPQDERSLYQSRVSERARAKKKPSFTKLARQQARSLLPEPLIKFALNLLFMLSPNVGVPRFCSSIEEILS